MEQVKFIINPVTPFNILFWASFQKRRLINGCECFSGRHLLKQVILNGYSYTIIFSLRNDGCIEVTCIGNICDSTIFSLKSRIYKMLDISTDSGQIDNFFLNKTKALFPRASLRIPGCFSVYEAAVRAVLGQQVSVRRAAELISLFTELCFSGHVCYAFPEKEDANPSIKKIASRLPVTQNKRNALIEITELLMLNSQTDHIDINDAVYIKGIGPWTIDNIKLRGFMNQDIWMGKDLIIRKVCEQMALPAVTDSFYNRFAPYRSYLTLNIWHVYNMQNNIYDDMYSVVNAMDSEYILRMSK